MNQSTLRVRIDETRLAMSRRKDLSGQSARRFDEIIHRFEQFAARGHSIETLDGLSPEVVEQFIRAKSRSGEPSIATMHLRRSTLRIFFRVAFESWGYDNDPTNRIDLPPRSSQLFRPLADDEVMVGRSFSAHTLVATRQPAAWALGEATATTGELPYITIDDLDLGCSVGPRVWLHGSRKRNERWGYLDVWGADQLERRASALTTTRHLVHFGGGSEETKQRSCCLAITETLTRSGLGAEPDIRPGSLMAWAGCKIFNERQQIEVVAKRLGIRSLDAAAKFINYNWAE